MADSARKILVVEDMENLREYIADTLLDLGDEVEVHCAEDGQQALEILDNEEKPFDLILSDISMPRMDGTVLLSNLDERSYPAAVIMLTAHGQDELIIQCLRGGACDYLVKPVKVNELLAAVSNALQYNPSARVPVDIEYDPNGWFEMTAGSDYSVLYRYRRFLGLLDSFQLPEKDAEEVRLTLEELGRNAIEWGNREDVDKRVRIGCRIMASKFIIQVADEGSGFIPNHVPDPTADPMQHMEDRENAGKRMGGYGIHLIRKIMDKVIYNSTGNVVVAIKYLNK